MSDLLTNARLARGSERDLRRVLIVTGDQLEARYWDATLAAPGSGGGPRYWVERGRKGNLLGALQAYSAVRGEGTAIDQILMFFGSGTRLSPFTQALRNVKAAFPLPDGERGRDGLTIGEAAIRSATPLIDCLRSAGFAGVTVSWGDEVLIPSRQLRADPAKVAGADVVRFGWRRQPEPHLAAQKEWLQVDTESDAVLRDVSRQPMDRLISALRDTSGRPLATFVNLGSFAATHEFLSLACDAFGDRVGDRTSAANWDPYFWQALQSPSRQAWDERIASEQQAGLTGLQGLLASVPDFYESVQRFRQAFERQAGRPMRVSVFDFGEPYWIDVGNHVALSGAFTDIFAAGESGSAIRAFLGLPDSLASGASFIAGSYLPGDCKVSNSAVIGTRVTGSGSSINGAVVLGSNVGHLVAEPGASVTWCRVDDLRVDGPSGIAFRLAGERHRVLGDESAATVLLGERTVQLRYSRALGSIDRKTFERRLPANPVSFAEAASLVQSVDPIELHRSWAARLSTR
ncbi:MAG TPA: hypothetical protein VGI64_11025 [Streptosporangiaceae bacterium]|jgi:hypothetical protein